jgi:hypothetical protein
MEVALMKTDKDNFAKAVSPEFVSKLEQIERGFITSQNIWPVLYFQPRAEEIFRKDVNAEINADLNDIAWWPTHAPWVPKTPYQRGSWNDNPRPKPRPPNLVPQDDVVY